MIVKKTYGKNDYIILNECEIENWDGKDVIIGKVIELEDPDGYFKLGQLAVITMSNLVEVLSE